MPGLISGRSRISAVRPRLPILLPSRWTTPVPSRQLWNVGPAHKTASDGPGRLGRIVGGVGHPGRIASAYSPKVIRPCAGSNLRAWARYRTRPRPQTDKYLRPHAD